MIHDLTPVMPCCMGCYCSAPALTSHTCLCTCKARRSQPMTIPEFNQFMKDAEIQRKQIQKSQENDPVNKPKHYNNSLAKCECGRQIECIDITRHMGFCLGNAVKYIWRYADKNGLEDLRKAAWYLNDFIAREEKK